MTAEQEAADAAANSLQKYRAALVRHGWAEADPWILAHFKAKAALPDNQLAAIVRIVLWARESRGGRGTPKGGYRGRR